MRRKAFERLISATLATLRLIDDCNEQSTLLKVSFGILSFEALIIMIAQVKLEYFCPLNSTIRLMTLPSRLLLRFRKVAKPSSERILSVKHFSSKASMRVVMRFNFHSSTDVLGLGDSIPSPADPAVDDAEDF